MVAGEVAQEAARSYEARPPSPTPNAQDVGWAITVARHQEWEPATQAQAREILGLLPALR